MDEVGEDGELLPLFDVVGGPVVGEFVAGLLAGHALGDPLFAAAQPSTVITRTVERH